MAETMPAVTINDLPYEILEMILSYVNPVDRRSANLVSKRFAEAADSASKMLTLTIDYSRLDDSCEPLKLFLNPFRHYERVFFGYECFCGTSMENFFKTIGSNLKELTISRVRNFNATLLNFSLKYVKVLEKIHLEHPGNLLNVDDQLEFDVLPTVRHFTWYAGDITKKQFASFVERFPNLTGLHLNFSGESDPAQYLQIEDVIAYVNSKKDDIKDLEVLERGERDEAKLLNGLKNLNLKKVSIPMNDVNTAVKKFLDGNKEITSIGAFAFNRMNPRNLHFVVKKLPNLKQLKIIAFEDIDFKNLDFLSSLPELETFYLSYCMPDDFFESPRKSSKALDVNLNMKCFKLKECINISHLRLVELTESYPNLRVLHLTSMPITDRTLQCIFKNLKYLNELDVQRCVRITDAGICGSPRLSDLKLLRKLDVYGCANLGNFSLLTITHLPELVELDFGECGKVDDLFVKQFARTCAGIEKLGLADQSRITNKSIKAIAAGMPKLKWLDISGCKKLTNKAVKYLGKHCRNLHILNSSGCKFKFSEGESIFTHVACLKLNNNYEVQRRYEVEEAQTNADSTTK